MSFSRGLSKNHQRYLGNNSLFLSNIDDTTKKKSCNRYINPKKAKEMVRVLITPACTVTTDCNHIALHNHGITQSDYGYGLSLEKEATNSTRPLWLTHLDIITPKYASGKQKWLLRMSLSVCTVNCDGTNAFGHLSEYDFQTLKNVVHNNKNLSNYQLAIKLTKKKF